MQTGSCYNGTGVDYKGFVSKTVSGKDCQLWGSIKSPYEPSLISISQHSELGNSKPLYYVHDGMHCSVYMG